MAEESKRSEDRGTSIHHREIMLPDGRYMVFYTFDYGGCDEELRDQGEDV